MRRAPLAPLAPLASVALAAAVLLGGACSSGGAGDDTTAASAGELAAVIDEVVVPRYAAFSAAAAGLDSAVAELCRQPAASSLDAARQQWAATRSAWRKTLAFGVGPAMMLRTRSAVDFAPSTEKMQEVLDGDAAVTPEAVADLGASARGLGAIELLLYGDGSDALAGPGAERRCQYAAAASVLVAEAADDVTAAWAPGAEEREEFLGDETMATNDLYNQVVGTLQVVADRRLATAVGEDGAAPDPAAADPGPAHRGLDDMVDDLDGTLAAYDAVLAPALERQSEETATRTRAALVEGRDALAALPRPLAAGVAAEAPSSREALETLKEAKRTLATEVASLLGLTLTFSESDGDA